MKRNGYVGGMCDPDKAKTCKKEHCFYVTGDNRDCRHTTNYDWIKKGEKWCVK